MGVDEAVDGLRTRAAAYAVGAYEFFENIRLNAAYTLFGPPSPEDLYTGSANPFSAKTVLMTGANQGIGLATARALYRRGGKVVLACRSLERGREAVEVRSAAVYTIGEVVLQQGRQYADGACVHALRLALFFGATGSLVRRCCYGSGDATSAD